MNNSVTNNNNNNHTKTLKRKRTMKTVQFSNKVTVLETYSSEEYDRTDIFSTPILYKINPNIMRSTPQLSLSIDTPHLVQDEGEISSADVSPNTPPASITGADEYFLTSMNIKKKKQRPILSVNTTMCADPLFFTSLTTNYKNDTNNTTNTDSQNDFLVPISATVL
ncbi:hypothetical protein HPULCUR_001986 [Helicostylum pulchrum]|uniref:Uncharacterized protein n=1 Tax=Helicostylum pulchrum TaxID=562976 RepID=A0ABP9XR23_9FUNG